MERWRLVRDLRAYASEMQGVIDAASMNPRAGDPLRRYLTFVLDYADRMDPLRVLREEVATNGVRAPVLHFWSTGPDLVERQSAQPSRCPGFYDMLVNESRTDAQVRNLENVAPGDNGRLEHVAGDTHDPTVGKSHY